MKKSLEDMKMLQVNADMIYVIRKILVLLKIIRNSKRFLLSIIDFHILKRTSQFFLQYIMMECSSPEKNIFVSFMTILLLYFFFFFRKTLIPPTSFFCSLSSFF